MSPDVLQRLVDESDIRALLARYARAIDRLDWELLRSCYHADATDAHGDGFSGDIDSYIVWLQQELPGKNDATMHFLGNQLIEIEGDVAWVETYCLAAPSASVRWRAWSRQDSSGALLRSSRAPGRTLADRASYLCL